MEIEEKPVPMDARHRTLGPSADQTALTRSEEMPLRFGPRHWGQSAAGGFAAKRRAATIRISFIVHFYHDLRRLHGCIFPGFSPHPFAVRSEEHTSELQSLRHLVCRLLL